MTRTRTDDREPTGRRKRVPLGAPTQRLGRDGTERDGFVTRWINDTPGRTSRAEQAGYEHVTTGDDRQEKRREIVGRNSDGTALYAYKMEIPQEYYDADQLEKQRPVDDFEHAIRTGGKPTDGASITASDGDKFYTPRSGGSRIQRE